MRALSTCLWAILTPPACAVVLHADAHAADINLIGIFGSKATLVVDGGKPRTFAVGDVSPERIKLLSVAADSVVVEIDGKRETLRLGNQRITNTRSEGGTQRVVLTGDANGHFVTTAQVNGVSLQFLVDTGATTVAISADDARRANVRFSPADRVAMQTANGVTSGYRVKLDTIRLGDITLNNVDGLVLEGNALGGRFGLLGMSFLNRTDMKREGGTLTLVKRF